MKKFIIILFLFNTCQVFAQKQHLGLNLNLGIQKTWKASPVLFLELRQNLQFNPELKKFDVAFGDYFNEDGFWPIQDQDDDNDDDDDDDDDDDNDQDVPNELNDSPHQFSFEWRSSSTGRVQFRPYNWFRINGGYTLFYNGEEFRQAYNTELNYRPLQHNKQKKKVDLSFRGVLQRSGQPNRKGEWQWETQLIPRIVTNWSLKKKHVLYSSGDLNGAWDEGIFQFDRWRLNLGIQYTPTKIQLFDIRYQYQKRIGKDKTSNTLNLRYIFRF